ncbi:hypothetical protein C457_16877 [Haloferax prahovense DSM 18310]|uniref:Uncharacterized protein n=1 Tax=Haloferax prahovense (strain DSM 18310 / JCM 13924 / TL6) TaxID=1227461 RepID=M0FZ07_HALPT|nr:MULTISPECIES: hypothetical protein [Haloferax]ELZ65195.1 hypothetical protein C457_16877 [Haloferax prahovense DSM 18310]RDZ48424.1 hypothetical protein C5B86_05100 [Haloferax sp. Atlit-19N]
MTAVWRVFFVSSVVLLAFLALSFPYVEPGTATFVVTLLSLGMLGVTVVGSSALIYFDWDPFEEIELSR